MKVRVLLALVVGGVLLVSGSVVVVADANSGGEQTALEGQTGIVDVTEAEQPVPQQQQQPPAVRGSPDLDIHVPDPRISVGRTNEVGIQISNDGDLEWGSPEVREVVTTARNVRVEADADGTPLTVETGEMAIGSVTENRPGEAAIAVSAPDDIEPGTYSIDVDVTYSHTYQQTSTGITQDRTRTWSTSIDVEVDDDARFSIVNATTDVQAGDSGTLEVEVENIGADTARDVNVALESLSTGFAFGESPQDSARIGELEPGERETIAYDVAFAPDAPVQQYTLDGTVQFKTSEGYQRVDESPSIGVTPRAEQRFSLEDVETDLSVGEDGDLYGTVTNEGPTEAQNVVVRYMDDSPTLIPIEQTVAVGSLDVGESASFRLPVGVNPEAEALPRTIDMAVQYRNADFEQRLYDDLEITADVQPQQRFSIDDVEADLYVGEDGDLYGTVTNEGPSEAQNVVVRYTDESPNVIPIEPTVAVGTLDAGESASFRLPLEVSGEARPVPQTIDVAVQYRNADFEQRLYEDLEVTADVAPKRDQFLVTVKNREIQAGDQIEIDVEVTNNVDQTVSDVEARLFADSPLGSDDDEAFTEAIEPGESVTMTFELEAAATATAKTHPVSFDFRYDDERGNSQLSDTTRVAIDVVESEEGFPWLIAVGVLVVIVGAAGVYYYQRG